MPLSLTIRPSSRGQMVSCFTQRLRELRHVPQEQVAEAIVSLPRRSPSECDLGIGRIIVELLDEASNRAQERHLIDLPKIAAAGAGTSIGAVSTPSHRQISTRKPRTPQENVGQKTRLERPCAGVNRGNQLT